MPAQRGEVAGPVEVASDRLKAVTHAWAPVLEKPAQACVLADDIGVSIGWSVDGLLEEFLC